MSAHFSPTTLAELARRLERRRHAARRLAASLRAVPETRLCVSCKVGEGRLLALAG